MRRLVKRLLKTALGLMLAFAALLAFLAWRTADPRPAPAWATLAPMPGARGEVATAVVETGGSRRLLVMGGIAGAGKTVDTVTAYDEATDRWRAHSTLPQPRHHAAATSAGGAVYVTGGSRTATNWAPERNTWVMRLDNLPQFFARGLPNMPDARMGHQMVAVGSKLYVVGGRGETSNVLIFDTVANRWSIGAQMPEQRDHLGVVAVGTDVYAIGGRNDAVLRRVDVYDTEADRWRDGPALPMPMSAMAAGLLPDGIHVVGGEHPATVGGRVIDAHFVLQPGATTWERAPLPALATHGSAAGVIGERLIIAGGARRQGALSPLGWTGFTQAYPRR